MALDFPTAPTLNQKFPASPVNGVPTYTWDGEKWTTVGGSIAGVPPGGDPPGTATPLGDITPAVVGVATKYSREDHRHPVDTSIASKLDKGGDTMTGNLAINSPFAAGVGQLTISSTTAGGSGIVWDAYHNSPTPAVNNNVGLIRFFGNNSSLGKAAYAAFYATISDLTPGAESGRLTFQALLGGVNKPLIFDGLAFFGGITLGSSATPWSNLYLSGGIGSPGPYSIATAADYLANTAGKLLTAAAAWAAAAPVAAGSSTALTPDFSTGLDFTWTYSSASGAVNNGTNLKPGQKGVIYITAGSAGCIITTWGSQYKFPGGTKPTMSTASGAIDAISYTILSSTQILCSFQGNFA